MRNRGEVSLRLEVGCISFFLSILYFLIMHKIFFRKCNTNLTTFMCVHFALLYNKINISGIYAPHISANMVM